MKSLVLLFVVAALLLSIGCGSEADSAATPDVAATEQAEAAAAPPTETPTPTADINATITASMIATEIAESTPPATPTPTPDIDATVTALMAATIAAIPTSVPTIVQTPTPTPEPTFTPVPEPTDTPTPQPTATRAPTATPRPTFTPMPPPTPVPTRAAGLSMRDVIRHARPAVVRIRTRTGAGSGVIFETQGQTAYVITNHHVVEGFSQVNVVVNDSANYVGTVRGSDSVRDLAMVSICCGNFRALPFGDASRLEPGDEVVAMGYSLALSGQASSTGGIVSALRYDNVRQSNVIQTDASINPGSSGGPLLSMEGEILGINTYRIDESGSGRVAEGVGFAVSETTVRERIPILKTSRAAPTPTPTRRPAPTRSYRGGSGYGPASGELRHDPSDGFIKTEYANVALSDLLLFATFVNPYSATENSWDYGFIFREKPNSPAFQIVVTSRGRWELVLGDEPPRKKVATGTLRSFDTGANGENILLLVAFGDRGLFFVNGDFIALLDLSGVSAAGDVAVITGAFQGDEVRGAITRFEEFQISPLRKGYGPASGRLEKEPGFVAEHDSGLWSRDFVAEATFTRPSGTNWDVGFAYRTLSSNRLDINVITGNGTWAHRSRDVEDNDYREIADGSLRGSGVSLRDENHLILMAIQDIGFFFLNGELVSRLDLSHNQDYGRISVVGDYFLQHQSSPWFENFNVWTP